MDLDCAGDSLFPQVSKIVETTLGVKGSQVQILSSRRSLRSLLTWVFAQVRRLLVVSDSIMAVIHLGDRQGPHRDQLR